MSVRACGFVCCGALLLAGSASCSGSPSASGQSPTGTTTGTTSGAPQAIPAVDASVMYAKFVGSATVTREGTNMVLRTTNVPDHKSPYFPTTDPRYQAYNGTNPQFQLNPNRIIEQQLVFRIPAAPAGVTNPSATPLGPIGVAVNGVAIFNQYAGPNQPLTGEINSFDQYAGHPQQTGVYHYHVEPLWITANVGKDALIGVLLDGFPVYGPVENGQTLASAQLDAYHGHVGVTKEFPQGIYHYHVSADAPYINGSGFRGAAGTLGR